MKKYTSLLFVLATIAILTTCKKELEIPAGGNKIEFGETKTDSIAYFTTEITTTLTATGGNEIIQHGHCWSTEQEPTIADHKTSLGKLTQPKTFTSELTELIPNTAYYIRSYITYKNGTVYGTEQNIRTLKTGIPAVSTSGISNITLHTAQCGGVTIADSGLIVTAKGICWDSTSNVSIDNNLGLTFDGDSLGEFISQIEGLNEGVNYFVKAYATNEKGTSYGELKQFSTVSILLPTVSTISPTNINATNAETGGNVTSDGNGTVTSRGVCWNITDNPTLENNIGFLVTGNGTGSFNSQLTGLTENTAYYIVAYATNEKGTSYGEVLQFSTLALTIPTVTTAIITNITFTSATSGGNVTSNGNGTITIKGVCWNNTGNPTLENSIGTTADGNGTGSFNSQLTGLIENTAYYVAAYATNEKGTSYGEIISFETIDDPCDGIMTFNYEDQTYNTVGIIDQCWMKENLNYQTGTSWCYEDDPANCIIYGRLYDWATIMNGESSSNSVPSGVQGICPNGWHLPSDEEWKILEGNTDTQYGVGASEWDDTGSRGYDAGKRLKTTTGWTSNTGTDAVGFSALPGGYRTPEGNFGSLGDYGAWGSATEYSSTDAWYRSLYYTTNGVFRYFTGSNKDSGFSVRCLRD